MCLCVCLFIWLSSLSLLSSAQHPWIAASCAVRARNWFSRASCCCVACLFVCLFVWLCAVCLVVCLFGDLFVRLVVCLRVDLRVYSSVCVVVWLFVSVGCCLFAVAVPDWTAPLPGPLNVGLTLQPPSAPRATPLSHGAGRRLLCQADFAKRTIPMPFLRVVGPSCCVCCFLTRIFAWCCVLFLCDWWNRCWLRVELFTHLLVVIPQIKSTIATVRAIAKTTVTTTKHQHQHHEQQQQQLQQQHSRQPNERTDTSKQASGKRAGKQASKHGKRRKQPSNKKQRRVPCCLAQCKLAASWAPRRASANSARASCNSARVWIKSSASLPPLTINLLDALVVCCCCCYCRLLLLLVVSVGVCFSWLRFFINSLAVRVLDIFLNRVCVASPPGCLWSRGPMVRIYRVTSSLVGRGPVVPSRGPVVPWCCGPDAQSHGSSALRTAIAV